MGGIESRVNDLCPSYSTVVLLTANVLKYADVTLQALLRRDVDGRLDPGGRIWAVPYRWGSMVIAYKKDKLAKNNIPPIKASIPSALSTKQMMLTKKIITLYSHMYCL